MRQDGGEQIAMLLHQGAQRAAKRGQAAPCRFITGAQRQTALEEARANGVTAAFDGGWADAERVQVCFIPMGEEPVFTAVWLEITWAAKFVHLAHSDLLGSLMSLGMDRSLFGDLIVSEDHAYLLSMPEVGEMLTAEWHEAGHTPIQVRRLEQPPVITPPQGAPMRDTIASLRLDCVLSSGMSVSRTKAADIIRQGLVQLNHVPEERTDTLLREGDLLSVRGFGRIRLTEIGGKTRKDRIAVQLEVFKRDK